MGNQKQVFFALLIISIVLLLPFASALSIQGFFLNIKNFFTGKATSTVDCNSACISKGFGSGTFAYNIKPNITAYINSLPAWQQALVHRTEGEEALINHFIIIGYSNSYSSYYSNRLLRVTELPSGALETTSKIQLEKVLSGKNLFGGGLIVGTDGKASANIDGLAYYFNVTRNSSVNGVQIFWGNGAYNYNVGNATTIFIDDSVCNCKAATQTCTPKTCSQLGKSCGTWSDGCTGNVNCGNCQSGYTCSDGICINETNQTSTCTDSDGGKNYSIKGGCNNGTSKLTDSCINSTHLKEYSCSDNSCIFIKYKCPYGCSNGVCVSQTCTPSKECVDKVTVLSKNSSCGDKYTFCPYGCSNGSCLIDTGNVKYSKKIRASCNSKTNDWCPSCEGWTYSVINGKYIGPAGCPSSCATMQSFNQDNQSTNWHICKYTKTAQQNVTCTDSDGGKNYSVKGTGTGLYGFSKDKGWIWGENADKCSARYDSSLFYTIFYDCCADSATTNQLNEAYCENSTLYATNYFCPYGCSNGTCISNITSKMINASMSIATLKDSYGAGELIGLTDPPDEDIESSTVLSGNTNLTKSAIKGYIVELKESPILQEEKELEQEVKESKERIAKTSNFNPLKYISTLTAPKESDIPAKIRKHRETLRAEREKAKQGIMNRLNKKRSITGNAVADPSTLTVISEYEKVFNGIAVDISPQEAERIKTLSEIKAVYPNREVKVVLMDSVPLIDANDVWKLDSEGNNCSVSRKECLTGKNVTIAIIDTGVDYTHGDLGGCLGPNCKVVGGYDFVNSDADPIDDQGHGTHVAGIAAGKGTLKGVAPNAKIYAYKVLNSHGSGSFSSVISGIERAVDPNNDGNTKDHVDVISMSLGANCGGYDETCGPDDPVSKAVDNAVDAGVIVVIAAGNSGPSESTIGSPGTARKAITVGATYKKNYKGDYWEDYNPRRDQIASFSSRGPVIFGGKAIIKPDVVAPGAVICAALSAQHDPNFDGLNCFDNYHMAISGTSMATPHVAGAAALLKQMHPDWNPAEIKMALKNTALNINETTTTQGYGRINTLQAVRSTKPMTAEIEPLNYTLSGLTNIKGTAKGDNFYYYSLFYSLKDIINWNLVCSGFSPVENGVLCENFDPSVVVDGDYYLRLFVTSNNGGRAEDRTVFHIQKVTIKDPMNNDIYRAGDIIELKGDILGNISNYTVEFRRTNSLALDKSRKGITLISDGRSSIINRTFATWNTQGLSSDFYNIYLTVNYAGGKSIQKEIDNIYLDSTLKEGWPKRTNWEYNPEDLALETASEFITLAPKSNYDKQSKVGSTITVSKENLLKMMADEMYSIKGYYYQVGLFEPVVSDINRDGYKEIILLKGGNPPKLLVYSFDGTLLFEKSIGNRDVAEGNLPPRPLVSDLDKDGYEEIVVYYGLYDPSLYAFNHDGSVLWNISVPRDSDPTLLIADLNLDGNQEVVIKGNGAYNSNETMTIVSNSGKILFKWYLEKSYRSGSICSSPAIGNFDDDPELEIVSAGPVKGDNEGVIYVYDINGSIVKGWPRYVPGFILSSPVVGDINKDGKHEIIVGLMYDSQFTGFPNQSYGGLYAFGRNGNILPGWPVLRGWNFWSTPALGDIDNDGYLEISASRLGFYTYIANHDGSLLSGQWPQYTTWNDYHGSIMGDITGDGSLDVLTTAGDGFYPSISYHGGVFAWNADGMIISGFPKVTEVDVQAAAVIDDIDNDGKIEIIATSNLDYDITTGISKQRGSVYVWEMDAPYEESKMSWPRYHHDTRNTGCYDCSLYKPRPQSRLDNFDNVDIKGFLNIKIQRSVNNTWEDYRTVLANKELTVPKNGFVKLDVIFNPLNVSISEAGNYSIYAEFADSNNGVAFNSTFGLITKRWEFKVI